jgi:hypothetical protein
MNTTASLILAAVCILVAGCGTPQPTACCEDASEYEKTIAEMQASGQLEKIEIDRDGDGKTDIIFWHKDGRLYMIDEPAHYEMVKIDLPPFEGIDRLVYQQTWGAQWNTLADIKDRGKIALFYQCAKSAVVREGNSRSYFDPDGELWFVTGEGEGGSLSNNTDKLVFLHGGKIVFEIKAGSADGSDFSIRLADGKSVNVSNVNFGLRILINRLLKDGAPGKAKPKTGGNEQSQQPLVNANDIILVAPDTLSMTTNEGKVELKTIPRRPTTTWAIPLKCPSTACVAWAKTGSGIRKDLVGAGLAPNGTR